MQNAVAGQERSTDGAFVMQGLYGGDALVTAYTALSMAVQFAVGLGSRTSAFSQSWGSLLDRSEDRSVFGDVQLIRK